MKAARNTLVEQDGQVNSLAETADAAKVEQRAVNMRAFREKYDAMLNLVEFMASLNMIGILNSRQEIKMDELKSLMAETRSQLELCQTRKMQFAGRSMPGKAG